MASLLLQTSAWPTRSLARLPLRSPALPLHRRTLMTLPAFSLQNKTCLVTGAARGLGKEFLTAFALSGARGACVDLSLRAGEATVQDIRARVAAAYQASHAEASKADAGGGDGGGNEPELRAYACDVTSETQVQDTWAAVLRDFGRVDVVLTAAGIVDNAPAEGYAYERWRRMFDVNLHGSFLFAREAGRYWIREKVKGNLILVSSMSAMVCVRPQKQAAYNAPEYGTRVVLKLAQSKGAVSLMGRSLCTEWAPYGIRVNSLCPGYMKTDLIIELLKKEGSHIEENWIKDIPMGRLGHPSELQGTVVWMASDASSYLNGSDILVDGGYCCY